MNVVPTVEVQRVLDDRGRHGRWPITKNCRRITRSHVLHDKAGVVEFFDSNQTLLCYERDGVTFCLDAKVDVHVLPRSPLETHGRVKHMNSFPGVRHVCQSSFSTRFRRPKHRQNFTVRVANNSYPHLGGCRRGVGRN